MTQAMPISTRMRDIAMQRLARMGQGGDNKLGHLSTGDIVIPVEKQTGKIKKKLAKLLEEAQIDAGRFTVGAKNNRNPHTGLPQFDDGGDGGGAAGDGGGGVGDGGGADGSGVGDSGGQAAGSGGSIGGGAHGMGVGGGDASGGGNANAGAGVGDAAGAGGAPGGGEASSAPAPPGTNVEGVPTNQSNQSGDPNDPSNAVDASQLGGADPTVSLGPQESHSDIVNDPGFFGTVRGLQGPNGGTGVSGSGTSPSPDRSGTAEGATPKAAGTSMAARLGAMAINGILGSLPVVGLPATIANLGLMATGHPTLGTDAVSALSNADIGPPPPDRTDGGRDSAINDNNGNPLNPPLSGALVAQATNPTLDAVTGGDQGHGTGPGGAFGFNGEDVGKAGKGAASFPMPIDASILRQTGLGRKFF